MGKQAHCTGALRGSSGSLKAHAAGWVALQSGAPSPESSQAPRQDSGPQECRTPPHTRTPSYNNSSSCGPRVLTTGQTDS